jgi:hypothetical protein
MSVAPRGRALFTVAALFNFTVAASLSFPSSPMWKLVGMIPPQDTFFLHGFLLMVAAFGCAYFWISREPENKEALIVVAIGGKLAVFALVTAHALAGSVSALMLAPAIGDLVFAVLFLRYLRGERG